VGQSGDEAGDDAGLADVAGVSADDDGWHGGKCSSWLPAYRSHCWLEPVGDSMVVAGEAVPFSCESRALGALSSL
jgi:hypothetical protein